MHALYSRIYNYPMYPWPLLCCSLIRFSALFMTGKLDSCAPVIIASGLSRWAQCRRTISHVSRDTIERSAALPYCFPLCYSGTKSINIKREVELVGYERGLRTCFVASLHGRCAWRCWQAWKHQSSRMLGSAKGRREEMCPPSWASYFHRSTQPPLPLARVMGTHTKRRRQWPWEQQRGRGRKAGKKEGNKSKLAEHVTHTPPGWTHFTLLSKHSRTGRLVVLCIVSGHRARLFWPWLSGWMAVWVWHRGQYISKGWTTRQGTRMGYSVILPCPLFSPPSSSYSSSTTTITTTFSSSSFLHF